MRKAKIDLPKGMHFGMLHFTAVIGGFAVSVKIKLFVQIKIKVFHRESPLIL
jgi:hypothetical protein